MKELEEEFYRDIDLQKTADELQLDVSVIEIIYVYWLLKRKVSVKKILEKAWTKTYCDCVILPCLTLTSILALDMSFYVTVEPHLSRHNLFRLFTTPVWKPIIYLYRK